MRVLRAHWRDRHEVLAGAIIVVYVLLALAYSVVNPLFESPDEYFHYEYVRYLIDRRDLPVMAEDQHSEFFQPPLYYTLGAAVIGSIRVEPFELKENPFWGYDTFRFGVDNKARYVHTDREAFPYRGTALAVHVLRAGSILLGVLTLIASYAALREVFGPSAIALGALTIGAFNPQYLFVSSSVSNDSLMALLGAVLIGLSIRIARSGLSGSRALSVAGLLALAFLTKLSAGVLAAIPVLAVLIAKTSWRRRVGALALVVIAVLVLDGWWFLYNWMRYGDPTLINVWQRAWGWQSPWASLADMPDVLRYIWNSYWGQFGLGQIVLPEWVYGITGLIGFVALFGLARRVVDRHSGLWVAHMWIGLGLLAVTVVVLLAAAIWYGLASPIGAAGRFLFPGMTAMAGLLFYGLRGVYRPDRADLDRAFAGGTCAVMIVFAAGSLVGVIVPAYAPPAPLTLDEVRRQTRAVDFRFGDTAILLGYAVDRQRVLAGDELWVKLCWQALAATESNRYFRLQLLAPGDFIVGRRTSFPGLGRYPTVNWRPGHIFCDDVPLVVEQGTPAPAVYDLEVGLADLASRVRLVPVDPTGLELNPAILTRIKVRSSQAPSQSISASDSIDFGGQITLIRSHVTPPRLKTGESTTVALDWRAERAPDTDYTVFVHLLDASGRLVAQADAPPQAGRYPTSFWETGEVIADSHALSVPNGVSPGEYTVSIGLYRLATGQRVPVAGDPDGAIEIGRLIVEALDQ